MKGLLSLLVCILAFVFFPGISGATADFTTLNAEGLRGALLVGQPPAFLSNHCGQGSCATVDDELSAPKFALLAQPKALPFENPDHLAGLLFNHNTLAPSWQKMDEDVSEAGQEWYLLAQIGTGPALAAPQVIRTPSRVVQPQSDHDGGAGHILATLQVRNIQVRAKWEVKNKGNNFTINALAGNSQRGVLRVGNNITLEATNYVVTVMAIDEFSYLNKAYENLTAMAELTIVAEAGGLSFADDSPTVNVTVGVQREGALYIAQVSDGENVKYEQIGTHSLFMVEVSDAGAVVRMIGELSAKSTVTLIIVASSGEERATLALEVRAYEELSASLAAGFVSQTYVGETGALGTVNGSGGSGDYDYSWALPLPVGFADTDGVLSVNDQAALGVYTATAIVSDEKLSSWVAATVEATVSVGAAFELSEGVADRLSVLVQGDVEVALLTLRVKGGARSYTYGLVESPSGLIISLSGDEGVLSRTAGESLPAGNNTVVIVVSDNYGGDTEPGTPDIAVTVILSAVLALSDKNPGSRVTVIVNESEDDFYSFEALGGYGEYVYSYTTSLGFSVSDSGTLSYNGSGTVGEVVLTVRVNDESSLTPEVELLLTVGISAALSATWSKNVQIFVGQKGRLREVGLSGVGGIPPYTYSLVSGKNISLNAENGDLHITMAFTSVATVSVVWSMEDSSDMGRTPAVSGTVVLDISGDLSFKETEPPVVNVTVGVQAGHVIYTAQVNTENTDNLEYKQIGGHSSFTVDVSDAAAGALVSMTAVLSAESTVTLTIEASKGEEQATLILEVRAYDELSASLAAGFVGQIYEGESGELGMIKASGGSGAYVYEWTLPLPVGFVDADGVLEADGQATVGVYTITAIAADDELSSWIAATVEATVSVGAALSLLEIEERLALVQGEVGEELLTVQVSGGDGSYKLIGQDLPSGLTISLLSEGTWVVKRAGNLSLGANVGTVIIDDSYSAPTKPGTPALTAVLTIVGVGDLVIASPQTFTATMGVSGVLASLSAEGGTEAKTYGLSTVLVGFSLSPAGVLSVSMDVDADSYTLTVVVSDETAGVEQSAMATLLVEVLERLRLSSVPSLTVTTSETQDVVYSFDAKGGMDDKTYSLENTVTGFEFDGGNLKWLGNAEAGLYTLSVLVKDGSPQPQESRVLVTVLVIENLVLAVGEVLSPVWSSFDGAVATLTASGGLGGELTFGLVGDSQVFALAAGSSTLSLDAGLRGHQGAATLSVTVSVSDGNDSAEGVITVLVSGALQVVLADGLVAPVHAQFGGLVGSVLVLGGYAGDVSLTLSGPDKDKFELSGGGSLSLSVNVSEEQTLTVTVVASRGDETAAQEVVVSVYAPLRLSMPRAVTVATHKGDMLAIIEGLGGKSDSYSYELISPPLVGVSIDASSGELLLSLTVAASHTLTVQLSDGAGSLPVSQEFSVLVIEPLSDISEAVLAVTLIEDVGEAAAYTFAVAGGIAPYSYTFVESQSLSVNAGSGVLSYSAGGAAPGVYVVTVSADDAAAVIAPIELLLTVEMSAALSANVSERVTVGVAVTGVLGDVEFVASGGVGERSFTLLDDLGHFAIDSDGGDFRITAALASAMVVSVVWQLDDTDMRTPAIEGTLAVAVMLGVSFNPSEKRVYVTVGIRGNVILEAVAFGGEGAYTYSQLGSHVAFTVLSEVGVGSAVSVSMLSDLAEVGEITLTIEVRDGSTPQLLATLLVIVESFERLSVGLPSDFVGQTYTGETGVLGTVEVSGGSGDYDYSWTLPLPVGFADAGGILSVDDEATVGVYTVTVVVSDKTLAEKGWAAATAEVTVSVGASLSLLEIEDRLALVQGEEGEELLTVQVSGGDGAYKLIGQDLPSGLTISVLADSSQWVVKRAGDLSVGANVGTVIIDDSYSAPTEPGTPALTAVLTIVGVDDLVIASPQTLTATMGVSGVLASLSAEGGTDANMYKLSPELSGFSLLPVGVLSVSVDVDADSYTLTVVVSDETARVEQTATATLLVEVLERLQLLSVPSLTVTTSETQDVVYSFVVEGGVGEKIYSLENTVTGFGFDIDGGNLRWLGDDEAGLYTLSVLVKDGSPQPQESRASVTVLVIEDLVLDAEVLSPVWSSFDGAVSTLSVSGGRGGELAFGLVGDSQVFTIAADSSTLLLNAGLRGHQGAATLSATVSVSDGNDSAEEVITVLVSGALQVSLEDGLIVPVHAQYEGLVGSVQVLGGYAGDVSLTLSGSDKDKFQLSGGSLSLSVNVSEEQTLTVTVMASRGVETETQEVVVSVYAPLGLSMPRAVTVTTHKGDVLAIIEGSGGDASSYSYELISPPLVGVSINAVNGELLLSLTAAASHTLTVQLSDDAGSQSVSQEFSVLVIDPFRDIGEMVSAVTLIENVGDAAVHTFAVAGGIAPYSYTFAELQGLSVNAGSGVLSYRAGGGAPGVYVVTVSADDMAAASAPIELLLTVEVSAVLGANVAERVNAAVSVTGVLPRAEFISNGGVGERVFALVDDVGHFAVDSDGSNFRITQAFTTVTLVSVVWRLDDADEKRTPAITGTIVVELFSGMHFPVSEERLLVTVGVQGGVILTAVVAGGDGNYSYSLIGTHAAFTVLSAEGTDSAMTLSMVGVLSEARETTLTIVATDSSGQTSATMRVIVKSYEILSSRLAAGFGGQTYKGEAGQLGSVAPTGGSGNYSYALSSAVLGFEVADEYLLINNMAAISVYTMAVIVSDVDLGVEGWIAATTQLTVSVGAAFELLEIEQRSALLRWQAGEDLLTIQVVGGELPYAISVQSLALGLTISAVGKTEGWEVARSGDLSVGDNVGTVIINDSYDFPTTPGTPALTVALTIVGVENVSLLPSNILSPVQSDFAGAVATLSVADGLGALDYRLAGDSLVFGLSRSVLLMTASSRGNQQAAVLSATVQIAKGVEELLVTIEVTVSTALSLTSPWSLVGVAADFDGILATLSASGGLAGEIVYSVIAEESSAYLITVVGNALSLRAQAAEEITVLLTMQARRGDEIADTPATVVIYAPLVYADVPTTLTVTAGVSGDIFLWQAEGGSRVKTYTIVAGNDDDYFTVAGGTLAVNNNARQGIYTVSAQVADANILFTATAVATVRVLGQLSLTNPPTVLTALVGVVTIFYTFVAEGGADNKTYTIISGHTVNAEVYFGAEGGTLSMYAQSKPGDYILQVQVIDDSPTPQMATATVTVKAQLPDKFILEIVSRITEVPSRYDGTIAVLQGIGGVGITRYTIVSGAEDGFSVSQEGVVNLSVSADKAVVLTVSVASFRNEPSNTVAVEVNVREPLQALAQGLGDFPDLLIGAFGQKDVARITIAGGEGAVHVELLPNGGVFGLAMDDENVDLDNLGRLWLLSRLSGMLTKAGLTLTLRIRDEYVSEGLLPPIDEIIVVNGVLLSASFAADFAHTTYLGEQGVLGQVLASGGAEDAYTLMPPVAGFGVLTNGDITVNATMTGLYTLTVAITNSLVELAATTAATVKVLPGLTLSPLLVQATLLAGATGVPSIASLLVEGGQSPYTVTVQGSLLSVGFVWGGAGSAAVPVTLYRPANSDSLTAGIYSAQVIFDDSYDGPTEPGTAPVPAAVTVLVVAAMRFESLPDVIAAFSGYPANRLHTFRALGGVAPTYQIVSGDANDYFSLLPNGELYLTTTADAVGLYTLAVEAADVEPPQKATVMATVSVQMSEQRIFVIGGQKPEKLGTANFVLASVVYSNDGSADGWSNVVTLGQLAMSPQHAVAVFRNRMYVVGGKNLDGAGVWSSNNGVVWQPVAAPFGERYNHQALSHNEQLLVLGGRDGNDNLASDVWSYDGGKWTQKTADGFVGREDFVALSRGGILYAIGGLGQNDVWASADGAEWTRLPMMGDTPAWGEGGLQGVVKDGKMIVYGGISMQVAESVDGIFWHVAASESQSQYGGVALYKKDGEPTASLYHFGGTSYDTEMRQTTMAQFLISEDNGKSWDKVGSAADSNSPLPRWKFGGLLVFPPDPVPVIAPPPLTLFAPVTVSVVKTGDMQPVFALTAYFGAQPHSYLIVDGNSEGYFNLNEKNGLLMMVEAPPVGVYTLMMRVRDNQGSIIKITTAIFVNGLLQLGDVFIAGGRVGSDENKLVRSRDQGKTWEVVNFPEAGHTSEKFFLGSSGYRRLGQMEYFQEKLWVIGGYTKSISGSGTQVWSSSNGVNWVLEDGQLPAPVEGHASAVHGNNLYVVGGKLPSDDPLNQNPGQPYVWIFNGEEWTDIGSSYPPPFALSEAGLVSHRGALYVAGGHRKIKEEPLKDVWRSDDGGYQWELAGTLSVGVWGHTMLSDGERMYVIRGGKYVKGLQSYGNVWSSIDGAEWSLESAELPNAVWSNGVVYQGDLLIAGGFKPPNSKYKNAWRSTDGGKSWGSLGESDVLDRSTHMMAVVDFPLITPEVKPPLPYWPQQNLLNSLPRGFAGVVGILQAGGGDGKYTYSLLNAEGFTVYANGLLSVTAALAPGTQKSFLARVDSAGESAYVQLDFYVLDESLDVGHMFVVGGETADKIDEGTNDVWRSIDGGLTWAKIAVSPTSAVTLPALDDHTVFWHENKLAVFAEDTYLSADGGVTWETIEDIPRNDNIENAAGVSYDNDMFIIGGGLAHSTGSSSSYSTDVWNYRTNVLRQGQWFRGDAPPQHGQDLEATGCANRKALARDDGIYLVGGRCGTSDYNKSVEIFSLGTGRYTNGVWRSYSGTEWSFLAAAPFLPRIGFALLETNGSMYVIGGLARIGDYLSNEYRTLNDVWRSSDGVHWEEVPIIGNRFTRRHGHGGAVDDKGNLVIFGGRSFDLNGVNVSLAAGPFGDVWKSGDGEIWTRYETNLPPARFDEGGAFMTFIPGKSVPSPLLSAGEITNEVPYGYQGKVARFFGVGGLPGSPFVYQLAGGSEQGFTIDESSGILSLDTAASGVSGGVARASVVVIRDDAPSARSKIVVLAVSVSAPLELNYEVTSQGFPTVLAGAFLRDLAEFEITGGQNPISRELLGGGDIFALESLDSGVGRRSRLLRLNEELTTGAITLTLRVRDAYVESGLAAAATDIEITIWAVSLTQLSPNFISQTFAGESGTLGRLLAAADEYNTYALNPPVSGFGINAQSGAITLGNLPANTYTLTMEVRNAVVAQESAVIATVIVGDALVASIQPTSVVVEAGQSVYADFATLSVSGGMMFDGGGYDITIVSVTPPLPAGVEFKIADDGGGRYLLSYESDAEVVNSLEYVVRLLVGDDYDGPTTPGTPPLEVVMTMAVSAAVELNYAVMSQGFPTVLAGAFMRNLAEFEITGGQERITLELLGGSDIFALESLDSGVGRHSRLLRLNQELTIGAITLTLRVRGADVGNVLIPATADIEITIWAVSLSAQLSPDFLSQTFAGESGILGGVLAVADEDNMYTLNPPVSGFDINAQSGAITLDNLSANTYTLTMEVRNADAAQESAVIATVIVGDALTASIQPTSVVVDAGQSVYADFATLSVSGGMMFDGGGYTITIDNVTPPLPAGAEFTITDDGGGRYLLSYESDAAVNSLEYVVRLMVGDDYDGPTTPGTPPLEVMVTMTIP